MNASLATVAANHSQASPIIPPHTFTNQALDLSMVELQALGAHAMSVERWGWRITCKGANGTGLAPAGSSTPPQAEPQKGSVVLSWVPLVCGVPLGALDLKLYLHQLADCGGDAGGVVPPGVLRVCKSKACRGAIMFNDPLTPVQCRQLVEELGVTQLPFCCAHGRPTSAPLVDVRVLRDVLNSRQQQGPRKQLSNTAGSTTAGGARSVQPTQGSSSSGRLSVIRLRQLL